MTNLISGKEALIALADGKEVEFETSSKPGFWRNISETVFEYTEILNEKSNASDVSFKFRPKPCTITLNIEIPAPFEPKDNENFYVIDCDSKDGYRKISNMIHSSWTQFGAWRTEEEIKQVVAALRQIFGLSDDAVNTVRSGK